MDSSDRRVVHANDITVETFKNFNIITRNVDVDGLEETSEELLCRAFTTCLKSYLVGDADTSSKGIVLVKNCFTEDSVPLEKEIKSALDELWKVQEKKQTLRRFILDETSRHRVIYRRDYKIENHRELECIFGPMQETVIKTINGALKLLNETDFCIRHSLDYHIRTIEKTKHPSQELISSLAVPGDQASAKQACHIDFPFLNAKGMSCFLSASCETKLEVLHLPEGRNIEGLKASDLDTIGLKFKSIEYDRCDFLIIRGDWPHRGTNYNKYDT